MRDEADAGVARLVRVVLPMCVLGAFALVLVRLSARQMGNTDTYFHLRFGHEFLDGWSLTDPGSVSSFASAEWTPTQWLSQVTMAAVENAFGLGGVAALAGLLSVAFVSTLYLVARSQSDPLPSVVLVVLAFLATQPYLSMRPQVVSFILLAVTAHLWLAAPMAPRRVWLLVPLTWLWAMCHGMWVLGVVVGLVSAVAWSLDDRPGARIVGLRLAVPVASLAVAGATPVGWSIYGAALAVSDRARYFTEWGPVDFTRSSNALLGGLLLGAVLLSARVGRPSWLRVGLLILAVSFALYSTRTVPVAAIILLPLLADNLQGLIGDRRPATGPERLTLAVVALVAVVGVLIVAPRSAGEPPVQPDWVDRELGTLPAGTPVLNDWNRGGYLAWRYPHLDPVMHGYGDTFTESELERNDALLRVAPHWDEIVGELGVEHALLPPDSALAYALVHQLGWEVVEESPSVELLVAPSR